MTTRKLTIHADGFEGYSKRALARARRLERREMIEPEITITFDNPLQLATVLTAGRLRLVQAVKKRAISITALASELRRDLKSVRRDIGKLEQVGVVKTREQVNPGHGRIRVVAPVAKHVKLVANL
jgi:predicted transcriptional regulator